MNTIGLAFALTVVFSGTVAAPFTVQSGIQDRLSETVKQASAKSNDARFWVVYSIKARHGIGVDEAEPEVKNTVLRDGLRISLRPASESSNVSIFLLYHGIQIEKVEIHDPDRFHARDNYPVHLLGEVSNSESIALLKGLLPDNAGTVAGERLVLAIGLHDDAQVAPVLLSIVNNSGVSEKERGAAAMWLGQVSNQQATLESLARNEELPVEVRKQAIVGLGFSRYPGVLAVLRNFYETFSDRELKQQALFAASQTVDRGQATAFLTKVKTTDPDEDLRQQASLWLQRLSTSTNQ